MTGNELPPRRVAAVALALGPLLAGPVPLAAGPVPAAAAPFGTSPTGATDFSTVLTGVSPAAAGVTVEVTENGERLRLVNTGPADVVVLGYLGEPYLRIGPT